MKKFKFITLAIAILGFTSISFAQVTATSTAKTFATILTPISITKVDNLRFGTIITSNNAGTVVIHADGTARSMGSFTGLNETTDVPGPASFTVLGSEGETFSVVKSVSVALAGPNSSTMVIDNLTDNGMRTIGLLGTSNLVVGGTLNIDANQQGGTYEGEISVTVAYD